eukprot:3584085-Rhodomonas_salina.2
MTGKLARRKTSTQPEQDSSAKAGPAHHTYTRPCIHTQKQPMSPLWTAQHLAIHIQFAAEILCWHTDCDANLLRVRELKRKANDMLLEQFNSSKRLLAEHKAILHRQFSTVQTLHTKARATLATAQGSNSAAPSLQLVTAPLAKFIQTYKQHLALVQEESETIQKKRRFRANLKQELGEALIAETKAFAALVCLHSTEHTICRLLNIPEVSFVSPDREAWTITPLLSPLRDVSPDQDPDHAFHEQEAEQEDPSPPITRRAAAEQASANPHSSRTRSSGH